jgi:uncharacterized membrane protein YeaQ/YmgE (transglycosylase-associated protein family)
MVLDSYSKSTKGETFSMNTKNLIVSSLIGGIVIAALANIPVLNFINCLFCIGYWVGSILAVWLYKRLQGTLTLGQGVAVGALAGVWSGLINLVLGLISVAGVATIISTVNQFLPPDTLGLDADFIGRLAILSNVVGVFLNIVLGTLGGLIGGAIFQTRPQPEMGSEAEPILPAPAGPAVEEITEESVPSAEEGEPPAEAS